jgi:hypothetical protein
VLKREYRGSIPPPLAFGQLAQARPLALIGHGAIFVRSDVLDGDSFERLDMYASAYWR